MGSLSIWHWIIVLVVVVLIFGTKKLGSIGKDLGEGIRGFKQGMTRAQWEDSINLMVRRHSMSPLDDKDREIVLNYLETAYPPSAPAGRGGWVNPFAK